MQEQTFATYRCIWRHDIHGCAKIIAGECHESLKQDLAHDFGLHLVRIELVQFDEPHVEIKIVCALGNLLVESAHKRSDHVFVDVMLCADSR